MLHMLHHTQLPLIGGADACQGCRNRGSACGDCALGAVIRQPGDGPLEFDPEERAAIAALAGQGLVPPLRLAPVRAA